jgi:peptide/nickel transport system permease protein
MVTRRKIRRYLKLFLPGIALTFFLIVGTFPEFFVRYSYSEMHPKRRLEAPSADFWFGTDAFGRDVYSRVIVGSRVSYSVSVGAVAVAVIGGVLLGVVGGLFKLMGYMVMRFVDVIICFPPILVAIFLLAVVKAGILPLILVIGFLYTPRMARVVQSAVLEVSQLTYIEAQRAVGASLFRIVMKGILPQIMAPMIVQATIMLGTAMLLEAGLSFLGLGIPPPNPTWGQLVSEARRTMHLNMSQLIFPGLVLSANVIFINLLGDGLRDFLDPKMRRSNLT